MNLINDIMFRSRFHLSSIRGLTGISVRLENYVLFTLVYCDTNIIYNRINRKIKDKFNA